MTAHRPLIGFCPLASGSKGNSIYVGTEETKLLIDVGIGIKTLTARLAEIHVDINEIDAILITHEHTDHIRGLESLACKKGIPVCANSDTAKGIYALLEESPKFKIFSTGESFMLGDIEIHPFSISHDTLDPVGFTMKMGGFKIGFCADLGFVTPLVTHQLQGCDYLYLEANHQPSMVHASARPSIYKQRVLGRQGHLSNEECAQLLLDVFHPGLKHVHLAHLSSECNAPELAMQIVQNTLKEKGLAVPLSIAYQEKISQPIILEGRFSRI